MKKTLLLITIILCIYVFIGNKMQKIEIPEEAIRIRVIANSNSKYDQELKKTIKNNISNYLYTALKDIRGIGKARKIIAVAMPKIKEIINEQIKDEKYYFTINYGYNYFPSKEYKDIIYKEGYYESLVITLGSGLGDNWWCVLFPPLCFIEASPNENIVYGSYIKEIIQKYM